MNDVTIAIKTFERPNSLRDLLISIRQYYPTIRIIVADDSKKPYAQEISSGFLHVECIILPFDRGLSAGRNAILSHVKTKYFVLCDDDFLFSHQTRLEVFKRILDESDIELIGGTVMDKSSTGNFDQPNTYAGYFKMDALRNLRMEYIHPDQQVTKCDIVANWFMANTRAVLIKTGGWDPRLKVEEHTDFFWRARENGLKVAFTPAVIVNHTMARSAQYSFYRYSRNSKYYLIYFKKMNIRSFTDGWETKTLAEVQPWWFQFIVQQKCIPWFLTEKYRSLRVKNDYLNIRPWKGQKKSIEQQSKAWLN